MKLPRFGILTSGKVFASMTASLRDDAVEAEQVRRERVDLGSVSECGVGYGIARRT